MIASTDQPNGLQKRTFGNLQQLLRHLRLVQEDTQLMGQKLIEMGECDFGRQLIANGFVHDNSKFYGIEWKHLTGDPDDNLLGEAVYQHVNTNAHHPEYWSGVDKMPRLYVAEMVCDWHARATEFGTDLRQWVNNKASKKYGISKKGKKWREIKEFMDLILEKPFG